MKKSQLQTGAVLALGLLAALGVYLTRPGAEPVALEAVPSPTPSAGRPMPSSTHSATTSPTTDSVSTSAAPSPSASLALSPSSSASVSATTSRRTVVSDLRLASNTRRKFVVVWEGEASEGYEVRLNGARISTVNERSATIIWDVDEVRISIVPLGEDGPGTASSLFVERPSGAESSDKGSRDGAPNDDARPSPPTMQESTSDSPSKPAQSEPQPTQTTMDPEPSNSDPGPIPLPTESSS